MENQNFIKQAKSDIFKEMHPIINFYVKKGAKPISLKKYYKNSKRFDDLLEDIKNKGINLIKDEEEYKKLVREVLNDILDDFINKEKDEEYKNKLSKENFHYIKEYNDWVLDSTGDYDIKYGDTPYVSDFVKDLKKYIEDNIDSINQISAGSYFGDKAKFIEFKDKNKFKKMVLVDINKDGIYKMIFESPLTREIDITKEEYNFLFDSIVNINKKIRQSNQSTDKDIIRGKFFDMDKFNL